MVEDVKSEAERIKNEINKITSNITITKGKKTIHIYIYQHDINDEYRIHDDNEHMTIKITFKSYDRLKKFVEKVVEFLKSLENDLLKELEKYGKVNVYKSSMITTTIIEYEININGEIVKIFSLREDSRLPLYYKYDTFILKKDVEKFLNFVNNLFSSMYMDNEKV